MQTNLLWTGREYYSLENCLVNPSEGSFEIRSSIVGYYEAKIYRADYRIRTNARWETMSFEVRCQHNDVIQLIQYESDGKGNWSSKGRPAKEFDGCIDIDIPLTPFTNTLPINRLQLKEKHEEEIKVIYVDLLLQKVSVVQQKYIRISSKVYHYENIPNDFEADIEVDESGFVVDYPSLFVRTAATKSNYKL